LDKKKKNTDKDNQQLSKQITPSNPRENVDDKQKKKKRKWPFTKQVSPAPGSM